VAAPDADHLAGVVEADGEIEGGDVVGGKEEGEVRLGLGWGGGDAEGGVDHY